MASRRFLLFTLLLVLAFGVAGDPGLHGANQAPSSTPGDLVPVSVRVIDRAGKPVTDLKASDFSVLEDGAPQVLAQCAPFALTPGAAAGDARLSLRVQVTEAAQTRRIFLIVIGLGRLEEPSKALTGLLTYVKTGLLPQDLVALFAYDRAIPFTTDHQRVADAIDRLKKKNEELDFQLKQELGEMGMAALYGARAINKKLQAKIDEAVFGPGAKPPAATKAESIDLKDFASLSLDDFMASSATTLQDRENLMAAVEYLRRFEGEKHLVFVTEKGFAWPSEENDRTLALVANDARVSIHPIQTGGVAATGGVTSTDMNSAMLLSLSLKGLRSISELTGGVPSIMEKGQTALEKADEFTRSGYVLAYQSSKKAWDGGYRTIAVRVNRPDVAVFHRHGYLRSPDAGAFDRRAFITIDRLGSAGSFRREMNDIKVKAAISQRGPNHVVEGKVDLSKVKLTAAGGFRTGRVDVAVYCLDSAGNPMGVHNDEIVITLSEPDFARYSKEGYPYTISFPIIRGTHNVRFVVYDFGSDLVGRVDTKVF